MRGLRIAAVLLLLALTAGAGLWGFIVGRVLRDTVTATVEFRVFGPWGPVADARLLVVGPDGRLLTSGLTAADGKWLITLTVRRDPRFLVPDVAHLGTVTAIAFADGFIERLYFDVPVRQGAVQVINLKPIQPHQRNEPGYELGMLHRLNVLPLIDHYAEQANLGRQPSVEGDWSSPHWSPRLREPG